MRALLNFLATVLAAAARLLRPEGLDGLVAENLLLKHQLVIQNRGRRRAPRVGPIDRLALGLGAFLLQPSRKSRSSFGRLPRRAVLVGFVGSGHERRLPAQRQTVELRVRNGSGECR